MAAITADTPVVNVPARISRAAFVAYLQQVKSPAAGEAGSGYDVIVANKVDPLFCLAAFAHESGCATNPQSVDVRYDTKNPGNTRTTRIGTGQIIQTDRGQFVKFASWTDGWHDLAFRLVDPSYVYAQQHCTTPGTIIPKFAPKDDGNDPAGYLQSVLTFMNQHQTQGGAPVVDIWYPQAKRGTTPYQNVGADYGRSFPATVTDVVMHHTDGSYQSAINYFAAPGRGSSGTSAHFVIARTGEVTQIVPLNNIAWHAGNWDENVKSIGIEHEQSQVNGQWQDWPDALLNASAELLAWLKGQMHTFNVYPHKNFTSTTCPGNLPIAEIEQRMGGAKPAAPPSKPDDNPCRFYPQTGHTLCLGFRAFYDSYGPKALPTFGYPISQEFQENGLTVQYLERARFELHPDFDGNPWHVQLGRIAADDAAKAKAANPEPFKPVKG